MNFMKKIFIYIFTLIFLNTNLFANTLNEALLKAYNKNPKLNAERENINISKENINISKSDFLPTVTLSGTKIKEDTGKLTNQNGSDASISDVDPLTTSLLIKQTLYDGKSRKADLENSTSMYSSRISIHLLSDEFGPAIVNQHATAIICTNETIDNCLEINFQRKEKGLGPLEIISVDKLIS